jgi:hypothetical protein
VVVQRHKDGIMDNRSSSGVAIRHGGPSNAEVSQGQEQLISTFANECGLIIIAS